MFNRESNDLSLSNHLQHRNVAQLLSTHIPENEALLLSDGKLTCTICGNRPIFDTIDVLAIHRSGKKHIHELGKYLQHKVNVETKALNVSKESHVLTGLTTKDLTATELLRRTPSNSRRFGPSRRLSLEIATPTTNILTTPPEKTVSPNNIVRKYLRSIEHSRPISKAIEESRDSYGRSMSSGSGHEVELERGLPVKPRGVKRRKNPEESDAPQTSSTDPEKSGFRLGKDGQWEKDPDAEFDSDEDD